MKPVNMMKAIPNEGDCLMACVASILEISLADLPEIRREHESDGKWYNVLQDALRLRGFAVVDLWGDHHENTEKYPAISPPGYTIAVGESPRGEGTHAVVALDGAIVHDPHPTRSGIVSVSYWMMLVPLQRGARITSQLLHAEALDL